MAAIGKYFFGVIENGSVVMYGNYRPDETDLTPTLYIKSKSTTQNKVKIKKTKIGDG